jgi:acetyltransferase-like isoleucine patch superfamily enzyme
MHMIIDSTTPLPSGCSIASGSTIVCDEFHHLDAFTIEKDVLIEADRVSLGYRSLIERGTTVKAVRGRTAVFETGDFSRLSYNTQVMVPSFRCGDYTQLFNSCLVSGYKPISVGHNCWVGQGAVLNCADVLTIGNNVRMGGSQIWTHVASGELLEGSLFNGDKPVTVEDNVWLMGFGHMIAPGVTLARNTVVMACSVVTKSTLAFHTYAGNPAVDISHKVPAWKPMSTDDKMAMLKTFVREFLDATPAAEGAVHVLDEAAPDRLVEIGKRGGSQLVFGREVDFQMLEASAHVTVFDMTTKKYLKRRTDLEEQWFRFANGFRARFVPVR